jgi:transposase
LLGKFKHVKWEAEKDKRTCLAFPYPERSTRSVFSKIWKEMRELHRVLVYWNDSKNERPFGNAL